MSELGTVAYTTAEVAEAFSVSPDYLRDLVKAGKVTPLRTSAARNAAMRFTSEHLDQIRAAMTPPRPVERTRRRRVRS